MIRLLITDLRLNSFRASSAPLEEKSCFLSSKGGEHSWDFVLFPRAPFGAASWHSRCFLKHNLCLWGSRRIACPWACKPKAEGSLCFSLPFSQQFPSCIHCWWVVKPYRAEGADTWEACAQASVLGQESGLSSRGWSDGTITASCLFWDVPVGLEQVFHTTFLHFPASCPAYFSFFMSQGWWPVPPSVGSQHQLLFCCITCTALLGESDSEVQFLSSSPPLPLTHDWQQQAGGGRPAGHKPALRLAWIHWKRPAEGLAEKSLMGHSSLSPVKVMCRQVALSGLLFSWCSITVLLYPPQRRDNIPS